MSVLPARRGACPRVWAPMESGDGLIVRVHPRIGGLDAPALRALVELAREHGNGLLELTRRANLQLRGVTAAALPALQRALVDAGLAAATPEQERRQVLLVNPLAGLDAACAELAPAAEQIEQALAQLDARARLPAKFGILLDSGCSVLQQVAADIIVDVRADQPDIAHLSVGLEADARAPLGACRAADLTVALPRLIGLLDRDSRMRDVVAARGIDAVRAHIQALLVDSAPPPQAEQRALIGFQRGATDWFGVALPFGAGDAQQWLAVAQLAEQFGTRALRLTPQRAVLLPGVHARDADSLGQLARERGLIVDARDPLLRVVACAGAPACRSAWGETRALARRLGSELLPRLPARATLHVSGCSKSCASRRPAHVTLVHDAGGCKLGFDSDALRTASLPAAPLHAVLQRLTDITSHARRSS